MAFAKQATTIATQTALAPRDLAVEICTSPWIVELSKNSRKVVILNQRLEAGCFHSMLMLVANCVWAYLVDGCQNMLKGTQCLLSAKDELSFDFREFIT